MEEQQERPPAYAHSDPDTLHLPSVPTQDPPSAAATNAVQLPDLRSLGLPLSTSSRDQYHASLVPPSSSESRQWQTVNSTQHVTFPRVPLTAPRCAPGLDVGGPMDTESMVSMDEQAGALNSKELLAAEAIVGLGNPDYAMSPSARSTTVPPQPSAHSAQQQEPLLSLLTSSHPWLGGTINGSLCAYTASKAISPRFIQCSADFLERNIANTISTVSRRTDIEDNLRRYLGDRPHSDHGSPNHKRRRVDTDEMDIEKGLQTPPMRAVRSRGESDVSFAREEALPPYDANRSPDYEEGNTNGNARQLAMINGHEKHRRETSRHSQSHWSTRMMITTSGLGAALSEKSLRSLKFCLGILGDATAHLGNVMRALRMVLQDYERATGSGGSAEQFTDEKCVGSRQLMRDTMERQREEQSRRLANRIKALGEEIWDTVKKVCTAVSQYTGGALPENARAFVRRQILSVPGRWQATSAASSQDGQDGNGGSTTAVGSAHRMLAFAREGLDMMDQVSLVVGSTIRSAEQWLDSLGRRRNGEGGSSTPRDEKATDGLPAVPLLPSRKE